jgi:hypothetical protein
VGRDRDRLRLLFPLSDGTRQDLQCLDRRLGRAIQSPLDGDGVGASHHVADTVAQNGMGENGDILVPSPTLSPDFSAACRSIWAPKFSSGSLRSTSLAMVTPPLQTMGAPTSSE